MSENQEIMEQIADITAAEMLRTARTTGRRKREISTIAKTLCIREEFLQALEDGNYNVIPETVYILGFARNYAMELGLNPDEVVGKIKKELGLIKEEEKIEVSNVEQGKYKFVTKEDLKNYYSKILQYIKKNWKLLAGIFGGLLVVLIVILLVFSGNKKTVQPVETKTEVATTVSDPAFKLPVHERFGTKNREEARVVLQAEKDSWVKIEDARGNSIFSLVLVSGDVFYMPNGDKYKGTFGNVGAIDVWVDGTLLKKLGPANTRKTGISMSPDALKSVGIAE